MKKIYLSILCFLLALLSSCGVLGNKLIPISYDTSVLNADSSLVCTTEFNEYTNDVKTFKYTIYNSDTAENWLSEKIELHKYDEADKAWKFVSYSKEISFNLIARQILPQESIEMEIQLGEYYNLPLDSGEYRLVLDETVASNTFVIK